MVSGAWVLVLQPGRHPRHGAPLHSLDTGPLASSPCNACNPASFLIDSSDRLQMSSSFRHLLSSIGIPRIVIAGPQAPLSSARSGQNTCQWSCSSMRSSSRLASSFWGPWIVTIQSFPLYCHDSELPLSAPHCIATTRIMSPTGLTLNPKPETLNMPQCYRGCKA